MIVDYESLIAKVRVQVARPGVIDERLAKLFIADAEADIRRLVEVPDMLTIMGGKITPYGIPVPEDCKRPRWLYVDGKKVTMPPAKISARMIIDAGPAGSIYSLEYWRHYSPFELPQDSNALLVNNPDIYWRAAVAYAHEYLRDDGGYKQYMDKFSQRVAEVNAAGKAAMVVSQMVMP